MRYAAVLVFVAACGFKPEPGNTPGDAMRDGGVDAPDAPKPPPDGVACYGTGLVSVCLAQPPPTTLTISTPTTVMTDVDASCTQIVAQAGEPAMCVIAAGTIMLDAQVIGAGTRPLVLVAVTTLSVNQTLDVSSHDGGTVGAGANATECVAPNQPEGDTGGGGGGAGGSFGGKGGDGGVGDGNNNGGMDGTAAPGLATAAQVPAKVRGGCPGGIAGSSNPMAPAGQAGGSSGGAVYLIAGDTIHVAATIVASGAGAPASLSQYGGPGGGSGGLVGLDAPHLQIDANVVANGGGGAEGGSTAANGGGGNAGADGTSSTTLAAAGGSGGTVDAGDGGDGSIASTLQGSPGGMFNGGGGGGGGGAGYIYVKGTVTGTGMFSPPASFH